LLPPNDARIRGLSSVQKDKGSDYQVNPSMVCGIGHLCMYMGPDGDDLLPRVVQG